MDDPLLVRWDVVRSVQFKNGFIVNSMIFWMNNLLKYTYVQHGRLFCVALRLQSDSNSNHETRVVNKSKVDLFRQQWCGLLLVALTVDRRGRVEGQCGRACVRAGVQ